MKDLVYDFTYQKIGHLVQLDEDDWKMIAIILERNGVTVREKDRKSTRKSIRFNKKDLGFVEKITRRGK